jgi:anti-sigma B factor antagonist
MDLDIKVIKGDAGTYRVILVGKLDTLSTPALNDRIMQIMEDSNARTIRLEITGLTYLASSGLGAFAVARRMIRARGGVLVVIGAQPTIMKVLEIVKIVPKEILFATPEDADAYLASVEKPKS